MSFKGKAKFGSVVEGWLSRSPPDDWTRGRACDLFNSYDSTKFVAVEVKRMDSALLVPNASAEKILVLGAPA